MFVRREEQPLFLSLIKTGSLPRFVFFLVVEKGRRRRRRRRRRRKRRRKRRRRDP